MCDTIVALGSATKNGATLFGKNSDREYDEVQNIKIYPHLKHSPDEMVKCTYITIPQVIETASTLLCQPFWMFGGEMGSNEYGVTIGNEALLTKEKPDITGLTGMDLLRLALERSKTAKEALDVIIMLLGRYGQGGNGGYRKIVYYMNSFIIADPQEAYVLETVKSWWAWKKIEKYWSISNIISLQQDFDECSPGLIENAIDKGYCKNRETFNFRKCYSDTVRTKRVSGRARQQCSRYLLSNKNGFLTSADFMQILRSHGEKPNGMPSRFRRTICMHATNETTRRSQSVCSLVAEAGVNRRLYWTTGASNPCLSPYFPIYMPGTNTPNDYVEGDAVLNKEAFWWKSEILHRRASADFKTALSLFRPLIDGYEHKMLVDLESGSVHFGQDTIEKYFQEVLAIIGNCVKALDKADFDKHEEYLWYVTNYRKMIDIY